MAEREEFSKIINELFELVRKDSVVTLALCPLNKKVGSFPAALMARLMIYYLNEWVREYLTDKTFKLTVIKIVCNSHSYARAYCTELLYMDENFSIGHLDMKRLRRMSEDLAEVVDLVEVSQKAKEIQESRQKMQANEESQNSSSMNSPQKPGMFNVFGLSNTEDKPLLSPQKVPEKQVAPQRKPILMPTVSDDEDDEDSQESV